jgi:hypothetical protein
MGTSGILFLVFGGVVLAEDACMDQSLILAGLYLCA